MCEDLAESWQYNFKKLRCEYFYRGFDKRFLNEGDYGDQILSSKLVSLRFFYGFARKNRMTLRALATLNGAEFGKTYPGHLFVDSGHAFDVKLHQSKSATGDKCIPVHLVMLLFLIVAH